MPEVISKDSEREVKTLNFNDGFLGKEEVEEVNEDKKEEVVKEVEEKSEEEIEESVEKSKEEVEETDEEEDLEIRISKKFKDMESYYEDKISKLKDEIKNKPATAEKKREAIVASKLLEEIYSDDDVIEADGVKMTMKDFANEYPQIAQSSALIAEKLAERKFRKLLETEGVMSKKDSEVVTNNLNYVTHKLYWSELKAAHPDAEKLKESPEFQKWFDNQPISTQEKAANIFMPEESIKVLDAYKKETGTKAKETEKNNKELEVLANVKKKKQASDDLHKDTLRGASITDKDKEDEDDEGSFSKGWGAE